jgi:probable rRNA maturation factor
MEEPIIQFFSEGVDFELPRQAELRLWLHSIASIEGREIGFINYIFCDDEYLLEMNRQYLDHDFYTDVITFPYSEDKKVLEGDIYISIDRVNDNAFSLQISFVDELYRVMIHGFLHLIGFDDHSVKKKALMSAKEDECLTRLNGLLSN